MVYVSNGQVVNSRPWGLGSITEMFWGIIEFFSLFFRTLVSPDLTSRGTNSQSNYRAGNSRGNDPRGPPPGPRKRMGGFGGGGCGPNAPPMAGGG